MKDPGKLTSAIRQTHNLLNLDLLTIPYDATLYAEALGCKIEQRAGEPEAIVVRTPASIKELTPKDSIHLAGRLPTIFETTKRLAIEFRGRAQVFPLLTGPISLATTLLGKSTNDLETSSVFTTELLEYCASACLHLIRQFLELGITGVIIVEQDLRKFIDFYEELMGAIWNLLDYYQANSILFSQQGPLEAQEVERLGAQAVVTHLLRSGKVDQLENVLATDLKCLGFEIPLGSREENEILEQLKVLFKNHGKNVFAVVDCIDNFEVPVSHLNELKERLHRGSLRG